jgi:hypothetical protein
MMSKYVLAFRGQPDRAHGQDEGQQWGTWFASLGTAIADPGNQVGTVRTIAAKDGADPATAILTGYAVIDASSLDEAARLASGCPGLQHGVSVEVAEVVSP